MLTLTSRSVKQEYQNHKNILTKQNGIYWAQVGGYLIWWRLQVVRGNHLCLQWKFQQVPLLRLSVTETFYFFGGNNLTEWHSLFKHYEPPPYVLPHTEGAYSFGIAGQANQHDVVLSLLTHIPNPLICIFMEYFMLWTRDVKARAPVTRTV